MKIKNKSSKIFKKIEKILNELKTKNGINKKI